jgi:RHS repeat-associated protein
VPNILLVLDANNNNEVVKTYVHANGQILMQHDGDVNALRYFYMHDRLGSIRQIIDANAAVVNCYYYNPYGSVTGSETDENIDNWYGFAGYYFDDETDSYYCNARNYYSGRFMTRDPIRGSFNEPMTLHPYLYCLNDPINATDPSGEFLGMIGSLWMRAKDLTVSLGAKMTMERIIKTGFTAANATLSGYLNMVTGPENVSDRMKFLTGFIGGAVQMELGWMGYSGYGAAFSSGFTNAANTLMSEGRISSTQALSMAVEATVFGLLGKAGGELTGEQFKEQLALFLFSGELQVGISLTREFSENIEGILKGASRQ